MDTEEFIPCLDKDKINIIGFNETEIILIDKHLELCRQMQENHQLFQVFLFNLGQLTDLYTVFNNDKIVRTQRFLSKFDDFTAINALVINYISSAKTLVESISNSMSSSEQDKVKDYISKVYDSHFSYKFLIRIRDYVQHGHLPVSYKEDKCCFDIKQIIDTPHFNHNRKLKSELDKHIETIISSGGSPHLNFTLQLAEFSVDIIKIYSYYLSVFENAIKNSHQTFLKILDNYSPIIDKNNNCEELIVYKADEENGHAFYRNEDPIELFKSYSAESEENLNHYDNEYMELKKSVTFKPI